MNVGLPVIGESVDVAGESVEGISSESDPSPDTSTHPSPEQSVICSSHSDNCSSSPPSDISDCKQSAIPSHLQDH